MTDPPSARYRFGPFEFLPATGELIREGERVQLQPQPARLLALLLRRAGELVTRDEIQAELWPSTRVEFDQGLNYCVRQIRAALGESADTPVYLETLPRRGYRFVAPVARADAPAPAEPAPKTAPPPAPPPSGGMPRWLRRVALGTFLVGVLIGVASALSEEEEVAAPAPRLAVLPLDVDSADARGRAAAERLVEQVVVELSRTGPERIGVIGPATTAGLGSSLSPVEPIRRRLGVEFVLSGRVRTRGDTVDAFTQLIRTRDGVHLWAERYRLPPEGMAQVEADVARRVERAIRGGDPAPRPPSPGG